MMTGFGVSCVVPMVFSMAGKIKHMSGGPAIAGVSTIGYFGFLIVPPTVGFIAEEFNLRWSIGLIALFGALITWLVSEMKEE
jgi:MFS family permease